MNKKQIVDLIISIFLIICGSVLLVFPLLHFVKIKTIFIGVLSIYAVLNLIQFLLTIKARDYEGLLTCIASVVVLIIVCFLDVSKVPWYLALTLFIWVIIMSLIKLKKADYYNDRENKVWILKVITLAIFVLSGLLATINLYYENDIQVLILGFFFLIHGILELFDPITIYLVEASNKNK